MAQWLDPKGPWVGASPVPKVRGRSRQGTFRNPPECISGTREISVSHPRAGGGTALEMREVTPAGGSTLGRAVTCGLARSPGPTAASTALTSASIPKSQEAAKRGGPETLLQST